ncbi:MAG: nucleotidyltransferase domain-containing protein [Candidatus Woesearchaeota archaeon]
MIEKSTKEKIISIFFDNPTEEYHLRELSRLLKLSMPTIISITDDLVKEKLIIKIKGKVLTKVKANREEIKFLRYKQIYNLKKIYDSSVIEYLIKEYNHPESIILFGSFSRGEDIEKSDIDIAIITKKKLELKLDKYSKMLKKIISIHEINLEKISDEFKANLANGMILEGSW